MYRCTIPLYCSPKEQVGLTQRHVIVCEHVPLVSLQEFSNLHVLGLYSSTLLKHVLLQMLVLLQTRTHTHTHTVLVHSN